MVFRYYTNMVSQASKSFAAGAFLFGLMLIGFGILILAFPEVVALLAAMIFFIAGLGCAATAIKIFIAQWRFNRFVDKNEGREDVQIHYHDTFEDV